MASRLIGHRLYELKDHLGNVRLVLSDQKRLFKLDYLSDTTLSLQLRASVLSYNNYYPFGLEQPEATLNSENYRFGFNGKENDREWGTGGSIQNFGARLYNSALARWMARDPLEAKYTSLTPYNFVANVPTSAIDPDGRLIIFVGGLRIWAGYVRPGDQNPRGSNFGIFNYDKHNYWSKKSHQGQMEYIADDFSRRIRDSNVWYTSGSSGYQSQAMDRFSEGIDKAEEMHRMIQSGQIKLQDGETIKIVTHSQGAAHGAGMATKLLNYKDEYGDPLYNVEVVYYLAPHQPGDIIHPKGVRASQYSHKRDAVSSSRFFLGLNGGSKLDIIQNVSIDDFVLYDIPGLNTHLIGDRGGHNVQDHYYIFDIEAGEPGYVSPRLDFNVVDFLNPGSRMNHPAMSTGVNNYPYLLERGASSPSPENRSDQKSPNGN